ncbi:DNA repair protein XRCC3-like isoform X2 [Bradysia coprophila]|uniref:DNA repair protein XRCC3-like isoform X2 n=1 Tax=Bradysia coprophila TaxID=38358 RepID=UPI00187DD714|nr:DNA repair protein XRCC3-like isoform X2 [Bradysia coprophila]
MNVSIECLSQLLPGHLVRRLREANCTGTTYSVLATTDEKFKELNFTTLEVLEIRNAVSQFVMPRHQPLTSAECIAIGKWKRITSGCRAIDRILGNGISTVGITEICGEAGSGKSQLCLQLAVTVQLPEYLGGLGRGAVYISTESSVPVSRTFDIAQHFKKQHGGQVDHINFSDNIFIKEVLTENFPLNYSDPINSKCLGSTELLECVNHGLPILMNRSRVGLLIIDSIGAVFRIASNYIARAEQMRDLCEALLKLSEKHRCAVVCVNQMSAVINSKTSASPENQNVPCLGLLWANLVTTRLQIHHNSRTLDENSQSTLQPVRKIRVMFAPDLRQDSAEFIITSNGVNDIK